MDLSNALAPQDQASTLFPPFHSSRGNSSSQMMSQSLHWICLKRKLLQYLVVNHALILLVLAWYWWQCWSLRAASAIVASLLVFRLHMNTISGLPVSSISLSSHNSICDSASVTVGGQNTYWLVAMMIRDTLANLFRTSAKDVSIHGKWTPSRSSPMSLNGD